MKGTELKHEEATSWCRLIDKALQQNIVQLHITTYYTWWVKVS